MLGALKAGLRELGYTEGRDYAIEHRSARDDSARLPALAAELVALKVDILIPTGAPSALAAKKATREIPILIVTPGDPVGTGLVANLARPSGNVTGMSLVSTDPARGVRACTTPAHRSPKASGDLRPWPCPTI